MSEDINYIAEIGTNLRNLFDRYGMSFDLSVAAQHEEINAGNGIYHQTSMVGTTYSLTIKVALNMMNYRLDSEMSSMDIMRRATIGYYRPHRMDHSETHGTKMGSEHIFMFSYLTNDLDDFLSELKKHAWEEYNRDMNTLIDGKLVD